MFLKIKMLKVLKKATIKTNRYGRSMYTYMKMVAYFPNLFIKTYLKIQENREVHILLRIKENVINKKLTIWYI